MFAHPRPPRDAFLRRNFVSRVMQPGVPFGRHTRRFHFTRVDNPAPLLAQRIRMRKAALLVAVIDVALCIPPDFLASQPGQNARYHGIAHAYPKSLADSTAACRPAATIAPAAVNVQTAENMGSARGGPPPEWLHRLLRFLELLQATAAFPRPSQTKARTGAAIAKPARTSCRWLSPSNVPPGAAKAIPAKNSKKLPKRPATPLPIRPIPGIYPCSAEAMNQTPMIAVARTVTTSKNEPWPINAGLSTKKKGMM